MVDQATRDAVILQHVVETVVPGSLRVKGVSFSHRVRFILLPVVPKPSFSSYDIQVSKTKIN